MHLPAPLPSPCPSSSPRGAGTPSYTGRLTPEISHLHGLPGFLERVGPQPLRVTFPGQLSPSGSCVWGPEGALFEPESPPCRTFLSSGFWGGCLTEVRGRPWGWRCQCGVATSSPSPVLAPPHVLLPTSRLPLAAGAARLLFCFYFFFNLLLSFQHLRKGYNWKTYE